MQYMFQLPGLKELRSHSSDGQCRLVGRLLLQIPCLFGGDDPGPQEDHVCENGPSGAGVQGLIGSHIF